MKEEEKKNHSRRRRKDRKKAENREEKAAKETGGTAGIKAEVPTELKEIGTEIKIDVKSVKVKKQKEKSPWKI